MSAVIGGEAENGLAPRLGRDAARGGNERRQKREAGNRAVALLRRIFEELGGADPAGRHADAPAWLHDLFDCVLRARAGGSCMEDADLAGSPAATFLARAKSAFLAGARRERDIDARDVLDLLGALESVGAELVRGGEREVETSVGSALPSAAIVEVAHDMRSPLNAIMLLVRTALDDASLRPDRSRQLGIVYSAVLGLNALVNDLVDSSQREGRLLAPSPVAFSVAETMQSVRAIVAPVAAEKGLALRVAAPRSEPRIGQPAALHRVLLNLVTNALKYTDTGTVTLRARPLSGTRMEFTVSDTGRGMSPGELAAVFSPLVTGDAAGHQRQFSSAGLGLAVCRTLVAAMGGRISVESVVGQGTTFRVELELAERDREVRLLPEPWRDEPAGDVAPTGSAIVLRDRPLRIPSRAD